MILISGVELETVFEGRDLLENGDILRQFFGMIWQINFHDYDWNWGRSSGKRKNCALRIRASLTIWETQKMRRKARRETQRRCASKCNGFMTDFFRLRHEWKMHLLHTSKPGFMPSFWIVIIHKTSLTNYGKNIDLN